MSAPGTKSSQSQSNLPNRFLMVGTNLIYRSAISFPVQRMMQRANGTFALVTTENAPSALTGDFSRFWPDECVKQRIWGAGSDVGGGAGCGTLRFFFFIDMDLNVRPSHFRHLFSFSLASLTFSLFSRLSLAEPGSQPITTTEEAASVCRSRRSGQADCGRLG